MTTLLHDLCYGMRVLLKHKSFTVVAIVTLMLGIGANTAMFSVLNTFLFRSLPYPQSSTLVRVFRTSTYLTLALRTATAPEALGRSVQRVVADLDPSVPVYRIRTARKAIDEGLGNISLLGNLLGAFGG